MATKKKVTRRLGQWIDDLSKAAEQEAYVHFETVDGLKRSGKVTGLRTRTVEVNDEPQMLVESFELNGDPMDSITFGVLAKIKIDW